MNTITIRGEEKRIYGTATARTRREAVRKAHDIDRSDAGWAIYDVRRGGLGYFIIVRDA